MTEEEYMEREKFLQQELNQFRFDYALLRNQFDEIDKENDDLKKQVDNLRFQLEDMTGENKRLKQQVYQMKNARDSLELDLRCTKNLLEEYRKKFDDILWS